MGNKGNIFESLPPCSYLVPDTIGRCIIVLLVSFYLVFVKDKNICICFLTKAGSRMRIRPGGRCEILGVLMTLE